MNFLVGTDIEVVGRFGQLIEEKSILLKQLFFESEYNYAINKVNSDQSFTGIWCAKEAVVKAFSKITMITIRSVEIFCVKNCAPTVKVRNLKLNELDFNISISISHTKAYATATAVLIIF